MRFLITAVVLILYSCKVSDKNLVGQYEAKSYYKSKLRLDSNNQFKFNNDGFEFVLRNESFLTTQGVWTRTVTNKLILNSISDSIAIPRFKITTEKLTGSGKSSFVFFNPVKDSVRIHSIEKNHKGIYWSNHGYLTHFEALLAKSDTLLFTFDWFFKPVQIVIDNTEPTKYVITLNREFKPNYFRNAEFIIRQNKLIRTKHKTKFRKTKSDGT